MALKVIIIGCGVSGPVLATLLKLKGYDPVIYERKSLQESEETSGVSLLLQPNGLKVLSSIPGLLSRIPGVLLEKIQVYSSVPNDVRILADSDLPGTYLPKRHGHGIMGVPRGSLLRVLWQEAQNHGIKIHWGARFVGLEQDKEHVTVRFADGSTDSASFVVGCDGLRSAVRGCLFGEEPPNYTGLSQVGGVSPAPPSLTFPKLMNVHGDGSTFTTYPMSKTHWGWAITERTPELTDSDSRNYAQALMLERLKSVEQAKWLFGAGDLIRSAERIVLHGLYDRPRLPTWHQGRVVLLGDAAHPTSPHLGQGANQAFEDAYNLTKFLPEFTSPSCPYSPYYSPDDVSPFLSTFLPSPTSEYFPSDPESDSDGDQHISIDTLSVAFSTYYHMRASRTADIVKSARRMGEMRVVTGEKRCRTRNDAIQDFWADTKGRMKSYDALYSSDMTMGM